MLKINTTDLFDIWK